MQPTLFDLPENLPPPKPKTQLASGDAVWTRYRPRRRIHCDDCIRLIHEAGQANAPFPRAVRWKRTTATATDLLCDPHAQARKKEETLEQA